MNICIYQWSVERWSVVHGEGRVGRTLITRHRRPAVARRPVHAHPAAESRHSGGIGEGGQGRVQQGLTRHGVPWERGGRGGLTARRAAARLGAAGRRHVGAGAGGAGGGCRHSSQQLKQKKKLNESILVTIWRLSTVHPISIAKNFGLKIMSRYSVSYNSWDKTGSNVRKKKHYSTSMEAYG